MSHYPHLFSPVRIGSMTSKNRLLMSAMSINFGVDQNGFVTDQLTRYLSARAKGGVGMMLVGGGGVHPTGVELPDLPALWDDGCIPALSRMVAEIKSHDCRFGMQLMHGGRQAYHNQKVAPSAIPAPALAKGIPRALETEEIPGLAAAFGEAARRCREAGFEFVEIHAAHGYLINQFLSPNANQRRDRYGGSFENRIRFLLEVLADIREKCGRDFPVGVRINGEDYIGNGWTLDDAVRLAPVLERKGAAYLHVSAGVYGSRQLTIPSMYVEQGCFVHLAEAVKGVVSVPVITVGRIKQPSMAEDVIKQGRADMVALGRSLLADPRWPQKVATGDEVRIRPCIGCCLGCIHTVFQLEPGGCVVNPDVGREYLLNDTEKAVTVKRVLVVGGGPAGLAAARMAARQGHRVWACEQSENAGGLLALAARGPGRAELAEIIAFFLSELERLAVRWMPGVSFDLSLLKQIKPHVVVLATGSLPDAPMIKGLFTTSMQVCPVTEVLEEEIDIGSRVIVWGGGQAGLVAADHLAEQGKQVSVLHRKGHFAEEMSSNDRFYLRERLNQSRVELYKQVRLHEVYSDGVVFDSHRGAVTLSDQESIVLADRFVAVRQTANTVKAYGLEPVFIGDARQPRHLIYAIHEGEEAGRNIH
jgi:2,4-dienoyl-CoA reductase-like NADH-dependent reductase (Old Yellow Enzyme family)/NAD(P)-dependent dehydrogenase (short-subunit alcohol dehydrogenase family)